MLISSFTLLLFSLTPISESERDKFAQGILKCNKPLTVIPEVGSVNVIIKIKINPVEKNTFRIPLVYPVCISVQIEEREER